MSGVRVNKRFAGLDASIPGATNLSANPLLTMIGATGFDNSNILATGAGGGYRGSTGGFTVALLVRLNAQVDQGKVIDYLDATGKGYDFFQPTATTLAFRTGDAAGTAFVNSPAYAPAGDLGKIQLLVGVHTGASGVADLWASKTRVGAGTLTTGYTLPSVSLREAVGLRQNGSLAHTGLEIYGWSAYASALSDAAILALYDYVYANGRLPTAGTAQYCWVGDDVSGASMPATVNDQSGGSDFTFVVGSASGLDVITRMGHASELFAWAGVNYEPRDAWLAFGDSMTDGRGDIAEAPVGYEPTNGLLLMCKNDLIVTTLDEPCGNAPAASAGVGPWGLCGWLITQQTGRRTVIVNGGVGGSRSDQWVPGQTNYNSALARIRHVCSRTNTTFRGFMLYMGPNDAAFSATPSWLANVQSTFAGFRAVLGKTAAQSPAVISRLTAFVPTDTTYSGWSHVQSAIASIADANHLLITPPSPADREAYNLHHKTGQNYLIAQSALAALMGHASWT